MPPIKPSQYLNWNPSGSAVVQPPDTLRARGYSPNEAPLASAFNWIVATTDQWISYLDNANSSVVMAVTLDSSMRLVGGGSFSFVQSSNTLTWSQPLILSIPSISDGSNTLPAASIVIAPGQVAYVLANVPFSTAADTVSGQATVSNLAYAFGVQAGQQVTGAGIPSGTTVLSVSGSSLVLSNNATATAQQTTLTFVTSGTPTVQVANIQTLIPSANLVVLARATASGVYVGVNSAVMILRDGEQRRLLEAGYHDVRYLAAGQALTALQAVHISTGANGRTLGAVYPTDPTAAFGATRSVCIGFVTTNAASGATATVMTGGVLGGFTGLTQGSTYWQDPATPGAITATRPSGLNYAVPVGTAIDATNLYVRVSSMSGAPVTDPSYNSLVVQPIAGDATTTALTLKDAGGNNKLLVDASGNVTAPSTFNIATLTASGTATAASFVSASGFKTTLAPAYLNFSISSNTTPGANGQSPVAFAESTLSQVYYAKNPFRGSIVGMQITYRFSTAQSTSPALTFVITVQGANNNQWVNSFNANNTAGGVDSSFTASQNKGVQPFAVNDNVTASFYSSTQFSATTAFYARLTIWVETLS